MLAFFSFLAGISFYSGTTIAKKVNGNGTKKLNLVVVNQPSGKNKDLAESNQDLAESQNTAEPAAEPRNNNIPETIGSEIGKLLVSSNPILSNKKEDDGNFVFAVLGDTQKFSDSPDGGFQKAIVNISKNNVDLLMAVGDLVSSCEGGSKCEGKLKNWKNIVGSKLIPKLYAAMGNHDRTGKTKADDVWQKVFVLPVNGPENYSELVYSFNFENSHFIFLNSEKPEEHIINKTQRNWLEKDLSSNKKENTFVFFHEPAYPVGSKIGEGLDAEKKDRDALWEILKKYKVTAVFNGHEHIYSRRNIDGVYQFVVGNTDSFDHKPANKNAEYSYVGKHYAIVEVKIKEITVNLYSVDGVMLNSFVIPR